MAQIFASHRDTLIKLIKSLGYQFNNETIDALIDLGDSADPLLIDKRKNAVEKYKMESEPISPEEVSTNIVSGILEAFNIQFPNIPLEMGVPIVLLIPGLQPILYTIDQYPQSIDEILAIFSEFGQLWNDPQVIKRFREIKALREQEKPFTSIRSELEDFNMAFNNYKDHTKLPIKALAPLFSGIQSQYEAFNQYLDQIFTKNLVSGFKKKFPTLWAIKLWNKDEIRHLRNSSAHKQYKLLSQGKKIEATDNDVIITKTIPEFMHTLSRLNYTSLVIEKLMHFQISWQDEGQSLINFLKSRRKEYGMQ